MKLLNFEKSKGDASFAYAEDFGALWDQAERLGEVTVGQKAFSKGVYEAQITFQRSAGSLVFAKGTSKDRHDALRRAMAEAVDLGATPS